MQLHSAIVVELSPVTSRHILAAPGFNSTPEQLNSVAANVSSRHIIPAFFNLRRLTSAATSFLRMCLFIRRRLAVAERFCGSVAITGVFPGTEVAEAAEEPEPQEWAARCESRGAARLWASRAAAPEYY
jgi:hypothetical protein